MPVEHGDGGIERVEEGFAARVSVSCTRILMESFRKLIEVFNGRLVDRVEKLSEKLNEIISAKRG